MKFGVFDKFGALNSAPIFDAFCKGIGRLGCSWVSHDHDADAAVIWSQLWAGRMRPNREIWKAYRSTGRPVIVLEVGMLDRGRTWKLGINGTNGTAQWPRPQHAGRYSKLGLRVEPWKDTGRDIIIAMQRSDSEQWAGMPSPDQWLSQTIDLVRRHSDRNIIVRKHPRQAISTPLTGQIQVPQKKLGTYDTFDFDHALKHAWCVINWNSAPGCQAVIAGVPAFVGASSLAEPVGNLDWSQIENPVRPDRAQWLDSLAHTEWTLDEISSGLPMESLLDCL